MNKKILVLIVVGLFIFLSTGCTSSGKSGTFSSSKTGPLKLVSLNTSVKGPDNGWKNGNTKVGFLNAGKETMCSLSDYNIKNSPILMTNEKIEYSVSVDIGGKFSIAEDNKIPFSNFPPIPPGFKIISFGKNDTYVNLNFRYAEAANPVKIEFPESNLSKENESNNLQPDIELTSIDYAGEQMVYGDQPIKKLSDLKGEKIKMADDQLEATFSGKCFQNERKNLISAKGLFAEVDVKNKDKFQEYRPESDWHIGYYGDGRGVYSQFGFYKPGMMMSSIGPGMSETLTFELKGTIVIFKGGCQDDYFVLDYSMCK